MNQDAHVHLHVIPRYQSKRMFARVEFQDNDEITNRKLPEAVQQEIVAALRNGMKG
jgi:diadenosine tetraphosphate (Ap4A) HIT family hydrolase